MSKPIKTGQYIAVDKTLSAGESYTIPANGMYCVSLSRDDNSGSNAWFEVDSHPVFGGYVDRRIYELKGVIPLAKGTVLKARSGVAALYTIDGYFKM